MKKDDNIIVDKSYKFALRIVNMFKFISKEKHEYVLSKQVLRSGTSIGALIQEAVHAESPADFIHKLKIAAKEAEETEYWLLLCKQSKHYPTNEALLSDINTIQRILTKIIYTTKQQK